MLKTTKQRSKRNLMNQKTMVLEEGKQMAEDGLKHLNTLTGESRKDLMSMVAPHP